MFEKLRNARSRSALPPLRSDSENSMNIKDLVITAAVGGACNKRLLAFLCEEAPAAALAKAQRSSDWLERAAIAMHPNTPPDVVARLAQDGNAVVRAIARTHQAGA
jgi:hypothetical protein